MQTDHQIQRELEALLEFHLEVGIDSFLGDAPIDWVARSVELASAQRQAHAARTQPQSRPSAGGPAAGAQRPGASAAVPASPGLHSPSAAALGSPPQGEAVAAQQGKPANSTPGLPTAQTVQMARDMAASARNLDELRGRLVEFNGCSLSLTAKNLVFCDGNPEAKVMLVGDAPGREEDQQGKPFVGRSGQLLDQMLRAIGLDRSSAYIGNVVPWRPPGDRTPTQQETELCKPFVVRQIELAAPEVLVLLGAASAKTLMGATDGIRKLRGNWMTYPVAGRDIACIATYDPAYLLKSPIEKRFAWKDFMAIRHRLSHSPE
ncbi:uracil-DNA glycosylase [Roseibium sp. CAU 1637]|uniref:Type-4 uracil-DNA glycosylase n=1 Tax=Roseibium limicola TaxID=2816037 RepID=A0A939ER05_9HYPH|nr:uracil-DNA glycosylase [Roseibium limicola]